MRNLDLVLEELRQLLSKNQTQVFAFIDDTFTLDKKRVSAICRVMKDLHRGPWFCEGRIGVLYRQPEIVELLAEAGLTRFQLGLESGCQKVLDAYRKETRPEEIRQVFEHCHKAGITSVIGNFIVGGAFEDTSSFTETLQMARDLIALGPGSTELLACYLFPYTGTAIAQNPQRFGVEFLDDLPIYNAGSRLMCVNRTSALSRGEISQYKLALQSTIANTMLEQIDWLPPLSLERHILNARDYQISSEWYEMCLLCKPLALFVRFLLEYEGRTWFEVRSRPDWLQWCPLRVSIPDGGIAKNGSLILKARRDKSVVLQGLDRHLLELASGKLSLEELLPFLRRHERSHWSDEALECEVREALERLASDFLLIFKEL